MFFGFLLFFLEGSRELGTGGGRFFFPPEVPHFCWCSPFSRGAPPHSLADLTFLGNQKDAHGFGGTKSYVEAPVPRLDPQSEGIRFPFRFHLTANRQIPVLTSQAKPERPDPRTTARMAYRPQSFQLEQSHTLSRESLHLAPAPCRGFL